MSLQGFRPINPWGRDASRKHMRERQELYQVVVETKNGEQKRVGPKVLREFADDLARNIRTEIVHGREKEWFNPTVVKASLW